MTNHLVDQLKEQRALIDSLVSDREKVSDSNVLMKTNSSVSHGVCCSASDRSTRLSKAGLL